MTSIAVDGQAQGASTPEEVLLQQMEHAERVRRELEQARKAEQTADGDSDQPRRRWAVPKAKTAKRGRPAREARIARTPAFVVAAANAFVGLDLTAGARRAFGSPPSVAERFLREVGMLCGLPLVRRTPTLPTWDAAFIQHVAFWALWGGEPARSSWPLPPVATAHDLSVLAAKRDLFDPHPGVGDLYLLWNDATERFVRTGIVVRVHRTPRTKEVVHHCDVIEGCTDRDRRHNGGLVLRLERRFGEQDRFVRWTRLSDTGKGKPSDDFNAAEEVE